MLRVGVLGAGNHSRRNHGPALRRYQRRHPDALELTAVCDLDAEKRARYAERCGFEHTFADYEEMLAATSLDALVAVTPVDLTREIAGDLLTRDVPLMIEKPPGRTVPEARELARIAADHGASHAVSMNRRFNPALTRAREWIADRPSGHGPQLVAGTLHRTGRTEPGFVTNTGIHAVDAVCAVLGRPTRVTSTRWRAAHPSGEGGHYALGQLTGGRASGSVELRSDGGTRAEEYEVVGPGWTAIVDVLAPRCVVWEDGEEVVAWAAADEMPHHVRNGTYAETAAFLDAVRGEGSFRPTLADVLPSLAAARAMDEGRSVVVDR